MATKRWWDFIISLLLYFILFSQHTHTLFSCRSNIVLKIEQKLWMSLDIAKGMHYLHTCKPPIVHGGNSSSYHIISYHIISSCLSIVLLHMRYTRHVTRSIAAWFFNFLEQNPKYKFYCVPARGISLIWQLLSSSDSSTWCCSPHKSFPQEICCSRHTLWVWFRMQKALLKL